MKFTKHDQLKSRLDLLPPDALELVGWVLRHGGMKYAPGNWRKCKDPAKYVAPILRHTFKHLAGDFTDLESGLPHLAHAICSGLFALDLYIKFKQGGKMNTRFNYFALVERKSKRRGIVIKRFRSYEAAWNYLTLHELEPANNIIKTVKLVDKVGQVVNL